MDHHSPQVYICMYIYVKKLGILSQLLLAIGGTAAKTTV